MRKFIISKLEWRLKNVIQILTERYSAKHDQEFHFLEREIQIQKCYELAE